MVDMGNDGEIADARGDRSCGGYGGRGRATARQGAMVEIRDTGSAEAWLEGKPSAVQVAFAARAGAAGIADGAAGKEQGVGSYLTVGR